MSIPQETIFGFLVARFLWGCAGCLSRKCWYWDIWIRRCCSGKGKDAGMGRPAFGLGAQIQRMNTHGLSRAKGVWPRNQKIGQSNVKWIDLREHFYFLLLSLINHGRGLYLMVSAGLRQWNRTKLACAKDEGMSGWKANIKQKIHIYLGWPSGSFPKNVTLSLKL